MSSKEKIFLFDMDGTLTPVRGQIEQKTITSLKKLAAIGRIGIVTGSDYDYIMQQMGEAFGAGGIPNDRIDLLPCNGTKKYVSMGSGRFKLQSSVSMIDEIGEQNHTLLLKRCLAFQSIIMSMHEDLPYTGTFLQYRGSLLNWCPIGRNATACERKAWTTADEKHDIRKHYASAMAKICLMKDIKASIALGGSTSLDIYPRGWDKTYALRYYPEHTVYFAGDKCMEGGNDWHIYEELAATNRSFMVNSPSDTVRLIDNLLKDN